MECFEGADVGGHEGYETAAAAEAEGVDWYSSVIGLSEDAGCVAFDGEGVKGACCNVEVGVCG